MTDHVLKCLNDCLDSLDVNSAQVAFGSITPHIYLYSREHSTEDKLGRVAWEIIVDNCLK